MIKYIILQDSVPTIDFSYQISRFMIKYINLQDSPLTIDFSCQISHDKIHHFVRQRTNN